MNTDTSTKHLSPISALRYRNFRLLWSGQFTSLIGTKMQTAALLWHITLLVPDNKKGIALGLIGLTKVIPIVFFSLISGVTADAFDRRRVMFITQTGMALSSVILSAYTLAGMTLLWPIYLLSTLTAAFASFDAPARQSLIPSLVPRSELPNALSLNSVMQKSASVLGPAVGGIMIAIVGVAGAYIFNAFSFCAVIYALVVMHNLPKVHHSEKPKITISAALDGFRFVFSTPLMRSTMLLDFFASFFSSATALLPIFAQDILHVGPHGYGWLSASQAIGAVAASVMMTKYSHGIVRRGRVLLIAVVIYGAATVGFGLSTSFWLTFLFLAISGAADTVSTVLRSVIRQLSTPDHIRGRMVSVNMIFTLGGPQLGDLEAGMVASMFTAPISVISGGICCIIASLWTGAKTPRLRSYSSSTELHIKPKDVAAEPSEG